jgi:hypothetical protein
VLKRNAGCQLVGRQITCADASMFQAMIAFNNGGIFRHYPELDPQRPLSCARCS